MTSKNKEILLSIVTKLKTKDTTNIGDAMILAQNLLLNRKYKNH